MRKLDAMLATGCGQQLTVDHMGEDFDGDGKSSAWEKLCFWIIAGFISISALSQTPLV